MSFGEQWESFRSEFGRHVNATHCFGHEVHQIYMKYPALKSLYTDFELSYDGSPIHARMVANNYMIPIGACTIYLLFCYFGQIYMKDREAFGLNNTLALWNLLLSVFSAWGAFRTVPEILYQLSSKPFENTVCDDPYKTFGAGGVGLAVQLFILSKIPELVDTVFIVLRKKPLIFLHWYHHVTVLLFCWNAYVDRSSNGLFFIAMNYTVHAVMYFYFFLQALKKIPKWFPSWIITLMQISQMIIGTFIVGATTYYSLYGGQYFKPGQCTITQSSLIVGGVIYASYLYLFVEFAIKRFVFGIVDEAPKKPKSAKKAD